MAVAAARAAGLLMRQNLGAAKTISIQTQHDVKLELDVRCQKLIEKRLRSAFPGVAILGEEGVVGDAGAPWRWVVDPIDGTVNFTYGIPHACVSIALQTTSDQPGGARSECPAPSRYAHASRITHREQFKTVLGVVYDPFCDELWTARRGEPARLNGRVVQVSQRRKLKETVISLGFGKRADLLDHMLPAFNQLVHRVRKLRIMGAAALALCYVASGRFDAFAEAGVRLWDIAAGGFILECAGGEFWRCPMPGDFVYEINGNNGLIRRQLQRHIRPHPATLL
jgi:myo-inositol-1(or 4)-monophosphatase